MYEIVLGIALTVLVLLVWKMAFSKTNSQVTITDEVRDTVAIKLQKHRADELEECKDYDFDHLLRTRAGLHSLSGSIDKPTNAQGVNNA